MVENHAMRSSSGTEGFFQEPPLLQNAFEEDTVLRRVYKFYLPAKIQHSISSDISSLGTLVLDPKTVTWCADAEKNPPYLRTWDTFGRRVDELVTSEGWRSLQDVGIGEGIVAIAYERRHAEYSRLHQFLKYHIWSWVNAGVTCPSAMTDGAARLLELHLRQKNLPVTERMVFEAAFKNLTSRIPSQAWTSGQWMTERRGGSDVSNTETQATYIPSFAPNASTLDATGMPLGPYSISGFKWFSSATDAKMTIMLAREPSGVISTFFAPMRRRRAGASSNDDASSTELNGVSIQRLKNKLGTRALPTAELVLQDMRGYRIGKPGAGVKEISTVLNITRIHNAVTAVGNWGRGLSVARAFARCRTASGKYLIDIPAHVCTMAQQHVEYRAMMHLTFFAVALLGISENPASDAGSAAQSSKLTDPKLAGPLLRVMTPLIKMLTARAAIAGLAECMEALGGVGYLENEDVRFNIARLFRDTNVLSIWEGTTNVMAADVVRVLKGSSGEAVVSAVDSLVSDATIRWSKRSGWEAQAALVATSWERLRASVTTLEKEELLHSGREVGKELGWVVAAVLLGEDAMSDGDAVAEEAWKRWVTLRSESEGEKKSWRNVADWDRKVVFGTDADRARL